MREYAIRRLLLVVPTIIGITIVVVGLVRLLPGDAVDAFADEYRGTEEEIEEVKANLRAQLGLDRSFPEQWAAWFWSLLQGDLGYSFHGRERTVWRDIRERIPVTFELGVLAMIVGLVIAMPVGIYSAVRQDTTGDYVARGISILFLAVPSFWLAILMISIVFPRLGLPPLPIVYRSPTEGSAREPAPDVRPGDRPRPLPGRSRDAADARADARGAAPGLHPHRARQGSA